MKFLEIVHDNTLEVEGLGTIFRNILGAYAKNATKKIKL